SCSLSPAQADWSSAQLDEKKNEEILLPTEPGAGMMKLGVASGCKGQKADFCFPILNPSHDSPFFLVTSSSSTSQTQNPPSTTSFQH
ncbi:hypothetical protein A2U01_0076017, partial [Trifolium medium]|nr:hypothetical protein [Trifolium medium]